MKKLTFLLTLACLIWLGTQAVRAEGTCKTLNLSFMPPVTDLFPGDPQYEEVVPLLEQYFGFDFDEEDWCWTQPVVGSMGKDGLNGTWVSCGSEDLALWSPLFSTLSGNFQPGPDLYGNPGLIRSRKGDIFTMSFGASTYMPPDYDWVAFGGVTWYGDGTGDFEGAAGWGTDSPKKYPPSYWIVSRGQVCYPE